MTDRNYNCSSNANCIRQVLVASCFLHHLRNRHELVTLTLVPREDAVAGLDAAAAVYADAMKFAVVQQDDVAAANLPLRMGDDLARPTSLSSRNR